MKKLASSLFASALILGSCLLGANAFADDNSNAPFYIVEGPCLSLDEPWKLSQLKENITSSTCKLPEYDFTKIEPIQGKTVKTDAGKAYFVEIPTPLDYEYNSLLVLGVRSDVSTSTDKKQIVSFYLIHSIFDQEVEMNGAGTSASFENFFEINNVLKGTYKDKGVKIIEINASTKEELLCKPYFFMNDNGVVDKKAMAKCDKTRFTTKIDQNVYVIADSGEVIGVTLITSPQASSNSQESADKKAAKKLKSLNKINEFKLSNGIKCKKDKSKDKKAAPTFTCSD